MWVLSHIKDQNFVNATSLEQPTKNTPWHHLVDNLSAQGILSQHNHATKQHLLSKPTYSQRRRSQLKIFNPQQSRRTTSGISPKSEPSLKPLEAGTRAKTSSDAHTAQSVQPQGLTSQRKADKKIYGLASHRQAFCHWVDNFYKLNNLIFFV